MDISQSRDYRHRRVSLLTLHNKSGCVHNIQNVLMLNLF